MTDGIGAIGSQNYSSQSGGTDKTAYLSNPLDLFKKPEKQTSAFTAMNSIWTHNQC